MATPAKARMARFLSYNLTLAQNSYVFHKGWRGNIPSRVHDVKTLPTPTLVARLHGAIDKYTMKCEDIDMHRKIDATNMDDYAQEIDNMTT